MAKNPLKYDPTRTLTQRRQFERDVKRRFRWLRKKVFTFVVEQDAFGLNLTTFKNPLTNTRFAFLSDPQKVKAFQRWFKEQVDQGLLEVSGGVDPDRPWTADHVESAYKKGVLSAYIQTKAAELGVAAGFAEGSRAQFLETAFNGPIGTKQLELLATRSFEQLKGITAAMSQDLSRILTEGLAHGHSPRKIASAIAKSISGIERKRALVMARTEIIHAYAEGQLDGLEQLGVEEVTAFVEWSTAEDDRVCPLCQSLNGVIMTIKEARGLIPRHPSCRCAWVPVVDAVSKNRKTKLRRAIDKSVKAERKKKQTAKQARQRSRWAGADVAAAK